MVNLAGNNTKILRISALIESRLEGPVPGAYTSFPQTGNSIKQQKNNFLYSKIAITFEIRSYDKMKGLAYIMKGIYRSTLR
jgi:hypothetical protein